MVLNGILMSGDSPVAEIRHGQVMPLDTARMPLYLLDHDDILGWLEERAIDRHRTNSRILKKNLSFSGKNRANIQSTIILNCRTMSATS